MDNLTLKSLYIKHKENILFDVSFLESNQVNRNLPLTTVLIGENGSGKSYLLTLVSEIFRGLDILRRDRDVKFRYDEYKLNYYLNDKNYSIHIYKNKVKYSIDGKESSMYEVLLPNRILAVSFMINDKFTFVPSKFGNKEIYSYLGVRRTSNATWTTTLLKKITDTLTLNLHKKDFSNKVFEILDFLNFEKELQLKFIPTNKTFFKRKVNLNYLKNKVKKMIIKDFRSGAINKYSEESLNKLLEYINSIVEINKKESKPSNELIIKLNLNDREWHTQTEQLIYLNMLNELQLLKAPELLLKKIDEFEFESASSGEKHLLYTLINLAAEIDKLSLILIDEPELSLHPNWQMKYVSIIKKLFSEYSSCHFIIATHSHYLISDLENDTSSIIHISIEKTKEKLIRNAKLLNVDTYAWSAENILYNIFGVRTSRNYYFENDLKELISLIENKSVDTYKINSLINKFESILINDKDPLRFVILEAKEYLNSVESIR